MPGAHKIGAAISGPQNYGRKFYGHHAFSDLNSKKNTKETKHQGKARQGFADILIIGRFRGQQLYCTSGELRGAYR